VLTAASRVGITVLGSPERTVMLAMWLWPSLGLTKQLGSLGSLCSAVQHIETTRMAIQLSVQMLWRIFAKVTLEDGLLEPKVMNGKLL
jgi:hypothetical protein